MDAKLTLKLDQEVIEKAKVYAAGKKLSLSRLIENYLNSLVSGKQEKTSISPFVKSLSSKLEIPADADYRKEYGNHLEKKHQ